MRVHRTHISHTGTGREDTGRGVGVRGGVEGQLFAGWKIKKERKEVEEKRRGVGGGGWSEE